MTHTFSFESHIFLLWSKISFYHLNCAASRLHQEHTANHVSGYTCACFVLVLVLVHLYSYLCRWPQNHNKQEISENYCIQLHFIEIHLTEKIALKWSLCILTTSGWSSWIIVLCWIWMYFVNCSLFSFNRRWAHREEGGTDKCGWVMIMMIGIMIVMIRITNYV